MYLRSGFISGAIVALATTITSFAYAPDVCHVYVVDVEKAKRARTIDDEKELLKALTGAETNFPEFTTVVGEEEQTIKVFPFPGAPLFITASVFYTDESMASVQGADSMLLGVSVAAKKQNDWPLEHALAEVTYNDGTDTVRVKKYVKVGGRSHLVGLECRAKPRPVQ